MLIMSTLKFQMYGLRAYNCSKDFFGAYFIWEGLVLGKLNNCGGGGNQNSWA